MKNKAPVKKDKIVEKKKTNFKKNISKLQVVKSQNNTKKPVVTNNNNNNNKKQTQEKDNNKNYKTKTIESIETPKNEDSEKYNLWNPKPSDSNKSGSVGNDKAKLSNLQEEMDNQLKGSRFRWLNERLYVSDSKEMFKEFKEDPSLFDQYHSGFKSQVEHWPLNPLDLIIEDLKKIKEKKKIADLGCGEAKLAENLSKKHNVQSFDLIAVNDKVTACDIANLPLKNESIDICVFCLSLMGTNFLEFIKEAHRVLVQDGILKIAEIESRITDSGLFILEICKMGFELIRKNDKNQYFHLFEFKKTKDTKKLKLLQQAAAKNKKNKNSKEPVLKPCLYKKR
ncbi:hypothetical protein CYY_004876 [Polysphondylium violaceum]|uniref:Ribosomal RNA-processing protein 8 n=1 Tax=Polysphondylium violaceum TaxID=133409 RepID=A0A8J4PSN6_9MYCE|nr:hypothetical protein CYY_004876 [Polysphondylium violaceum]